MNIGNYINKLTPTQRYFIFGFLVLACLALPKCKSNISWREEVKIRTGEVLTVERTALHMSGGGGDWVSGSQSSYPIQYSIRFEDPFNKGKTIEWQSQKKDLTTAGNAELPLVLDLTDSKTWVIYTFREVGENCIRYVPYQFEQGKWIEKPLTDQQIPLLDSNLYLSAHSNSLSGIVGLAEIDYSRESAVWVYRQVGPYQLSPTYFEAENRSQVPPLNNKKRCVFDETSQIYKMISENGDKK